MVREVNIASRNASGLGIDQRAKVVEEVKR